MSMTTFDTAYAERTAITKNHYDRARKTIPGGAGSTARLPRNG
jgi:glutamate-1-semialdehyde 2,1-aminomutase